MEPPLPNTTTYFEDGLLKINEILFYRHAQYAGPEKSVFIANDKKSKARK